MPSRLETQNYNHIFKILFIGLIISIACFIAALENYHNELRQDFNSFAHRQSEFLTTAIDALIIKIRLVKQLYFAAGNLNDKEYKELVLSIQNETTAFDAFLIFTPTVGNEYRVEYFAGVINGDEIKDNLPLIKMLVSTNEGIHASKSFKLSGNGNYIALSISLNERKQHKGCVLMGILNLDKLFEKKAAWIGSTDKLKSYVYDNSDLSKPFYILDTSDSNELPYKNDQKSLFFDKLRKNAKVCFNKQISIGNRIWTVLLIPTNKYILVSFSIFPWLVLISGLSVVSLLAYYSFRLSNTLHKLKMKTFDLARSETLMRNIINYAMDGLITINEEGIVESFNPACEKMFGYKVEEVVGENIEMLIPSLFLNREDSNFNGGTNLEISKIVGVRTELKGKKRDDSIFPLDLSFTEVEIDGKRLFSGIVRDITELKEAVETREKLIQRLTESNIELEQFAYVASHDLQEPLRVTTNYTSLIVSIYKNSLDKEVYKYISTCMNAVKRMQELVSDLLEYAKLGQDKIRLTLIDCDEIISNVVANLSDKIKERNAKVVYNKLPKIYGNSILFISLFQNLINNALKYQPEDNTPIIEIGAKDLGDSWLFYVKDNGLGIDERYLKQIFIPFKRLHTKHEFPGSGIGLAICKRIINKCSGNIWAESDLGKGSTFYFTLLKTTANNQDLVS